MENDGAPRHDPADEQLAPASNRVRQQIIDALEIANYVVENGIKDADDQPLPFADIQAIHNAAAQVGILNLKAEGVSKAQIGSLTRRDWIAFEQAYYRLSMAVSPVTAETLRDTADTGDRKGVGIWAWLNNTLLGSSPAQRFTRKLWYVAIVVAGFILVAEWRINALGMEADAAAIKVARDVWQWLLPWGYGALGACAYLLRSGHYFIYQRSFDLRRTPEYFNRVLLGAISGGTIILFASYRANDDDTVVHLSSAALGFIAGYSTDFLFNTIERIITAIFPRVAVETVPRDSSKPQTKPRPRQPSRKPAPNPGPQPGPQPTPAEPGK
jgi:hypothetical protein